MGEAVCPTGIAVGEPGLCTALSCRDRPLRQPLHCRFIQAVVGSDNRGDGRAQLTMADHSMGLSGGPATGVSSPALATHWLARRLQGATAWAAAAVLWTGMAVYFWQNEGEGYFLFTAAVTATLIALAMLLTRRALF